MATHYKGQRISELLEDIARLQRELDLNQSVATNAEEVVALVEGQATLAIAKAKLTALQGE
jgi:hypothetical protein